MEDKLLASLLSHSTGFIPHLLPQEGHDLAVWFPSKQSGPGCLLAWERMQGIMQSFAEESSQRSASRCSGVDRGSLHPCIGAGSLRRSRDPGSGCIKPLLPYILWDLGSDFHLTFL